MIAINIPQTQYLISNRWTFEHPMRVDSAGKPMGPAVALVGAAGTIGAGISMGGVLGGLMIAGGIASGIGGLSGNKFLSNLGMGLSLVGGIGGAFTAAGPGQELFGYNPFGEGGFQGSALGDAVTNWFSDFTGNGTAGTGLPQVGKNPTDIVDLSGAAADTIESQAIGNGGALEYINGEATNGGGLLSRLGSSVRSFMPGESGGIPGSGPGGLLGNKDFLSAISGGVDGYYDGKKLDLLEDNTKAEVGLYNARTRQTDFQTDLAQRQYENMQYQTVAAPTFNSEYSTPQYNGPAAANTVVVDPATGKIMSLNPEQYAQWQQQQGARA